MSQFPNFSLRCLLLFLSSLLLGCEKTITVDLPDLEPRIVLNSNITPNLSPWAYVSKLSADIDNSSLNNATVQWYENGNLIGTLPYNNTVSYSGAVYIAPALFNTPQVGNTYTIKVSAPNLPDAEATQTIPPTVSLQNPQFTHHIYLLNDRYYNRLQATLHDDPNSENFYRFSFYTYRSLYQIYDGEYLSEESARNMDFALQGSNGFWHGHYYYVSDQYFNGESKTFNFDMSDYYNYENDTITLIAISQQLSPDLYYYAQDIEAGQGDTEFFNEPVTVYSNVQNGIGIFGAFSSDTLRLVIEP
jgi:hypothetical protein